MRRVLTNIWVRILCTLLCIAFTVGGLLFTSVAVYMGVMRYFNSFPESFTESEEFRVITDENVTAVWDSIITDIEYGEYEISYPGLQDRLTGGFYYRAYDKLNGSAALWSNCDALPSEAVYTSEYDLLADGTEYRIDYAVTVSSRTDAYGLAFILYNLCSRLTAVVVWGVLCWAVAAVFLILLCTGAGRSGDELKTSWFDRLPFAVAAAFLAIPAVGGCTLIYTAFDNLSLRYIFPELLMVIAGTILCCAVIVLLLATVCARIKNGVLLKNTLIYFILSILCGALRRFFDMIPVMWKRMLMCTVLILLPLIFLPPDGYYDTFKVIWFIVSVLLSTAYILEGLQLKKITAAAGELAAGKLDSKTNTKGMVSDYRKIAESLNSAGEAISIAVDERMKSEHLKTELVTNVSHDLKTPLTSIISYIGLLKNEKMPTEATAEYVEVLDRQSQRLKRLIEDLTEISKAATGNITPRTEDVDIVELLVQSVGEYEEKFSAAGLEIITDWPEKPVRLNSDGTLVWRCVNNLMSNMVKYSLSGTRAYISLTENEGWVQLVFRNISRDRITVPVEELTERFVRGDTSRGGEGSGLGLAIVSSFSVLLGGNLRVEIDGDLFKATLWLKKDNSTATVQESTALQAD